jgi:ATP-dependent RNA helicase DeaD
MSKTDTDTAPSFASLGLPPSVLEGVTKVGYESASPIQAATIPALLEGHDILGQAQTGTGKTAAFALPVLARLDIGRRSPQALVLVPTRELAIQVAEAFQKYAACLPGFHVLPVYGGQSYTPQLKALERGTHVIVGTPGRVMDHLDRGTLKLDGVKMVVLDEADEMLAMGFADAMEAILSRVPTERQVALFSATMAPNIKRIAQHHLRKPREILIKSKTTTGANIRQRFWLVSGVHKLDALTRILEVERFDAMLVFARTKQATVELAEKLEARGFPAAALNGDIPQAMRERIVNALKGGKLDIVVATDVAARGLDVERISHVVNFDVPYDTESYVHRIGRTGRAGRNGEAILFIAPRERNMLRLIERATRQPIQQMDLPTAEDVNERRLERFRERVTEALATPAMPALREAIERLQQDTGSSLLDIAAALASLTENGPALLPPRPQREAAAPEASHPAPAPIRREEADPREERDDEHQITWRLAVGRKHNVEPSHIVGAIANTLDLRGNQINGIDIRADYSFVRLPGWLKPEQIETLSAVRVRGQSLSLERSDGSRPTKGRFSNPYNKSQGRPAPRNAKRPSRRGPN